MTTEETKKYVSDRIELIKGGGIKPDLNVDSGILLHFIPNELLDVTVPVINWSDKDHSFNIKHSFRRFTGFGTTYTEEADGIIGYTPHMEYFKCFQNGIQEVYKAPIERKNSLSREHDYVCIDDLFYPISDFLNSCKTIHQKLYNSVPPYSVIISLLNITGTYFVSFDKNYVTIDPFNNNNIRFEPFELNDSQGNLMPEIIAGVHYGFKTISQWTRLG